MKIDLFEDIKKKTCYVSKDYNEETKTFFNSGGLDINYELPDGEIITIGYERIRSCESIFDFSMIGKEKNSLPQIIYDHIMKCDIDLRRELYYNIRIIGEDSGIEGLSLRTQNELKKMFPSQARVNIISPVDRKYSVWIGGSILSSLHMFQRCWVSKDVYDEKGLEFAKNPNNIF